MTESLDKIVLKITNKEDLENKYGILLRHIEQIKSYNKRLNWIIILRPINKEVASKLKSGGRGKIISIKGKSSEFTFLAGDIPYEAGLSKLGKDGSNSDWSRISHFNSINKQSIENSYGNKKAQDIKQQIEELRRLESQELQQTQQELNKEQQKLRNKTLEYNLNFNLSKIKKIVEIDVKKYESFYETDGNGNPKYE